ncbi:MAG: hypothetical protein IKP48_11045 [Bacteroidaceae bacterium]|nr:hypothetical protein [Bacteroidaceae bacterium]
MKRLTYLFLVLFWALSAIAQDKMFASYQDLISDQGDVVTTLNKSKRSINQIYMSPGADYEIYSQGNKELTEYLKKRTYAVRLNDTLYVNLKHMKYKKYRFGNWYALAQQVQGNVYFQAQPLGQIASSTLLPKEGSKLGGSVGDAINASGLVNVRVYYVIDPLTGIADFVGKEKMTELLANQPDLLEAFGQEESEGADVIGKYLEKLK